MSHPRAFISFDFDNDENSKILFAGQIRNSRTPFDIEDWSSKNHLPQLQWERIIKEKINKCNLLIVLVGLNSYKATGVKKEIEFARQQNVPYFGIYVGGASERTPLPQNLQASRIINWQWDSIAGAINQLMNEGKNGIR